MRLQTGETIRSFAERHLKDADLWPQILELNGLASPAGLAAGAELLVPVRQVAAADAALADALGAIQRATAEGARVFAPVEIGAAIEDREAAVERRLSGDWDAVVTGARRAVEAADAAYAIARAQRDRAAEAVVSDISGALEGRAPEQPSWSSRQLRDVLVEFERVRTLSASTAQVTFRDLSRLRLNPNSNALIERMRTDPLTGGQSTRVSLVEGDFYALLTEMGERNAFEVEVPGVETRTRSTDFWVQHDPEATRLANYDDAALEVTARGETISVGENEGAMLAAAGGAARKVTVLEAPRLSQPPDGAPIYDAAVDFAWTGPEAAVGYWLEVAADVDFNRMQVSEWGLREPRHAVSDLPPGSYYWRVSALDRLGLPGTRSLPAGFALISDDLPPFLDVVTPGEGEIVENPVVTVAGESEPAARLTIDGRPVETGADGRFGATVTAAVGENVVTLAAVDPAGNRTERQRRFVYRPPASAEIAFDGALPRDADGRLLTRAEMLDLRGTTSADPGARLRVRDAQGGLVVEALVADDRSFAFAAPATAAGRHYVVEVAGPTGAVEGQAAFDAVFDATPPGIVLDEPPPAVTAEAWLELSGAAGDAVALSLDGAPVKLDAGRFETLATLDPGLNAVELVAADQVGNVSVLRLETRLDLDPPEILSSGAARPDGASGPIEIEVGARDPSGLRQTARYVLSVGGTERSGFLRCDTAASVCRDVLPPEAGELALIGVVVEDYAGNAVTLGR